MTIPYQCLAACSRPTENGEGWTVFGAAGPRIAVQSSTNIASVWQPEEHQASEPERTEEPQEPAEKRIKLSPAAEKKPIGRKPNFSSLKLSHNQKYLIGITGEDKAIRVFEIVGGSQLKQLSERCMARRPCSIALTADDSKILCADKFGDVYSLPLIPSPEEEAAFAEETEKACKQYVPSASLSTVHSGRNRKVLEEQLKQAQKGRPQPKDAPKFKHELLLGHVSMLTDIVSATVGSRSYILTADRDEHIRVSRGLPQAHIIEGFCHGHNEFVNKLCMTKFGRLVSGGGDAHLYVWDWVSYQLLEKLPLQAKVVDYFRNSPELKGSLPEREENFKIAVSGIWSVPFGDCADQILVACEGVPAIFSFVLGSPSANQTLLLNGNALDVTFVGNTGTMMVSIDHVHKPGSTTEIRDDQQVGRLEYFSFNESQWRKGSDLEEALARFSHGTDEAEENGNIGKSAGPDADASESTRATFGKTVRDMLYGVENLRKRPEGEAEISG